MGVRHHHRPPSILSAKYVLEHRAGGSRIVDAQDLADAYRASDVHIIRIKSKEVIQSKWLGPFFLTAPEKEFWDKKEATLIEHRRNFMTFVFA